MGHPSRGGRVLWWCSEFSVSSLSRALIQNDCALTAKEALTWTKLARTRPGRTSHGTCGCGKGYCGRFTVKAISMTALASKSRFVFSSCAAWILHRYRSSPCSSRRTISALNFARDEKTASWQSRVSSPSSSTYGSIICIITSVYCRNFALITSAGSPSIGHPKRDTSPSIVLSLSASQSAETCLAKR